MLKCKEPWSNRKSICNTAGDVAQFCSLLSKKRFHWCVVDCFSLSVGLPKCHAKSVVVVKPTHHRLSAARQECRNVPTGAITINCFNMLTFANLGVVVMYLASFLVVPPSKTGANELRVRLMTLSSLRSWKKLKDVKTFLQINHPTIFSVTVTHSSVISTLWLVYWHICILLIN